MRDRARPFDFELEAHEDFATGAVPIPSHDPRDLVDDGHPEDQRRDVPPPRSRRDDDRGYLDDHDEPHLDDLADDDHDPYGDRDEPRRHPDDRYGDRDHDDYQGGGHRDDGYDDEGYDQRAHHDDYDYDDPGDPPTASTERSRRRQRHADSGELLRRVIDIVAGARSLPLSASVSINRDEVLELLEEAQQRLPDELREARWLRKEREEYLEKMRSDGDEILAHARTRVEQMVQRTEIAKAAEHRARRIIETADANARRMRLETEDYCDHRLSKFESVLEEILKNVISGRARLQNTGARDDEAPPR